MGGFSYEWVLITGPLHLLLFFLERHSALRSTGSFPSLKSLFKHYFLPETFPDTPGTFFFLIIYLAELGLKCCLWDLLFRHANS